MSNGLVWGRASASSDASGPTRTISSSPESPTAMLPWSRNARPPNIAFSVTAGSAASCSPHALGEIFVVRHAVATSITNWQAHACASVYLRSMVDVFQVLAEPRRRDMLALLAADERTAGDIARRFEVTRQAVSQHLRILLEAGLIRERREGTRRWYSARPEGLAEVRAYVEAMWPSALGDLKIAAEHEHASKRDDARRN
jgi:DNA-binding transcriptional ArsR family regulator